MTPGQQRALAYIRKHIKTKGHSPSYVEIGAALGLNSKASVHSLVHSLIDHGKLRMVEGAYRSLEVVDDMPALAERLAGTLVRRLIIPPSLKDEARATLLAALRA